MEKVSTNNRRHAYTRRHKITSVVVAIFCCAFFALQICNIPWYAAAFTVGGLAFALSMAVFASRKHVLPIAGKHELS